MNIIGVASLSSKFLKEKKKSILFYRSLRLFSPSGDSVFPLWIK